jgi:hypothetical protein
MYLPRTTSRRSTTVFRIESKAIMDETILVVDDHVDDKSGLTKA